MSGLEGRNVLVTGASGGIGGAVTRQLVGEGALVYAAASAIGSLTQIVDETGAVPRPFNLTDEASIRDAVAPLRLWGLVNCAGWGGTIASPWDVEAEVFDDLVRVNSRGPLLVTKYASRWMVEQGGGSIVNVSSQSALTALAGHVAYTASKGALDAITRVSALELGRHGVRVNVVHPTVVMTEMSEGHWGKPENRDPFLARMPFGRFATPPEIAAPIVFLLGDGASMVNGASLAVDGGYSIC